MSFTWGGIFQDWTMYVCPLCFEVDFVADNNYTGDEMIFKFFVSHLK